MLDFKGRRFWVSNFVPRSIIKDIKARNGEIVTLERTADICLTDHKKSAQPPGAYSWLWIKECVEKDAEVDESRFAIAELRKQDVSSTGAANNAGEQLAPRLQSRRRNNRTEYTPEDDRILIRWIRENAGFGPYARNSVNGNELYKQLAAKYPHHSFHSWRDRWLKRLSKTVSLEAPNSQDTEEERDSPQRSPEPEKEQAEEPEPAEENVQEQIKPQSAELSRTYDGPLFFMDKKDYVVMVSAFKAFRRNQLHPSDAFFQTLSEEHDALTADEWRERYMKLRSWYDKAHAQGGQDPNLTGEQDDEPGEDGSGGSASQVAISDDAILEEFEAQGDTQQKFLEGLDAYGNAFGVYVPRAFIIGGRILETWTLWRIVQEVSPLPEGRDWTKIVEALDFDVAKYPTVEKDLALWYDQNLENLGQFWNEFQEAAEGQEEESNEEDEEDGDEEERAEEDEGANGAESTPAGQQKSLPQRKSLSSTAKRQFESAFPGSDTLANEGREESPSKRVRFSSKASPTVEKRGGNERNGEDDNEEEEDDNDSSAFTSRPTRQSSKTPQRMTRTKQTAIPAAPRTPRSKPTSKSTGEPETQDFAYDRATQQAMDPVEEQEQDAIEATPSQQLHTEERVIAATPLTLSGTRLGPRKDRSSAEPPARPSSSAPVAGRRSLPASFSRGNRSGRSQDTGKQALSRLEEAVDVEEQRDDAFASNEAPVGDSQDSVSSVVDRFVAMRYPQEFVVRALRATNGEVGLAGVVMERLMQGKRTPPAMAGVWTTRDDQVLSRIDQDALTNGAQDVGNGGASNKGYNENVALRRYLEKKHGVEHMQKRRTFLAQRRLKRLGRLAAAAA